MTYIIVFLLVAVLLISVYQLFIIRSFKKTDGATQSIPDARYFELKYQIESYVKVFAVLMALVSYLGYMTFQKTQQEIEKAYIEPLTKYESRLNDIDSITNANEAFIKRFNAEKEAINSVLLKTGKDANAIKNNIDLLAQSRINKLKLYVCIFKFKKPGVFYFKDLRTYDGQLLPKFKKTPFLNFVNKDNASPPYAMNVKPESFEIDNWTDDTEYSFYLWILSEE